MPPASIAFIYKSLGCLHSLQPTPANNGYQPPCIPALKAKGFVTWQTIQLLLGPEEHVPFLQNAVHQFDIMDPVDGSQFPKILPKECFPDRPDEEMLIWYDKVSDQLRVEAAAGAQEAQAAEVETGARANHHSDEWSSTEEKSDAAKYFSNPLYKDRGGRPDISPKYSSKHSPRVRDHHHVSDRGHAVIRSVRHLINPRAKDRRRSLPDRYEDEEVLDDDITPTGLHPSYVPRRPSRQRDPSTDSDESFEEIQPVRRHSRSPRRSSKNSPKEEEAKHSPTIRQHSRTSSHEQPASPPGYFPPYEQHHRRVSEQISPEVTSFGPSKAPPFAAQVAQMSSAYNGRPALRDRVSDRVSDYRDSDYRDRDRDRDRERERDRDRDRERDRLPTSAPTRYGRSSAEPERPRFERPSYVRAPRSSDRFDRQNRSQSDDRLYGREFNRDRERDRYVDRDRDRERDRRPTHRYVTPVDGVGGRKYPVVDWR
jgi:hypothetical protein